MSTHHASTTNARAATDRERLAHALRLAMTPGIGPVNYRLLSERLGSPQQVLEADPATLQSVPGIGVRLAQSLATAQRTVAVEPELARCEQHGLNILECSTADYPLRLQEIPDPPPVLFCRGELNTSDSMAIAIVGTRHATGYGIRQSERLARGLAQAGFTIVSGLARGIDAAAHRAALEAGGRTVAVLGSGLLNLYPSEHADLSLQIADQGAVVSEYPTLQPPRSGSFPQRNRIVTGLSLGVIVIEAGDRSGAMISARHAAEQGRDVFAVPGPVDSSMSSGCHQLIRDGAILVTSVDDVLEGLGPLPQPVAVQTPEGTRRDLRHPAELKLNSMESQVLQQIGTTPTEIDDIVETSELPIQRVLATLSALEMRRLVQRCSGTRVRRV